MDSDKFQSVDLRKYICPVPGIKVLVVDNNLTSLATVSEILHTLRYEVVTASLASEALCMVEENKNELNLALVDVDMRDMEINTLTEKIQEVSNLQCILMTANDNPLCNGSMLYFKKPVKISDLSSLWKYSKWKIEDESIVTEDVSDFVNNSQERQPFMNAGRQILQIGKRLSWTDESRRNFLEGVELARTSAPPNQIYQLRNVRGLAKENVQNHLQPSFEQANHIQQHRNVHSSDLNLGSEQNNDIGTRRRWHNHEIRLCDCMLRHSQRNPLYELSISSDQASTQLAHHTSGSDELMNGNEETGETCAENPSDGKFFNEDTCAYCVDDLAVKSEMDTSTLLANDMCQLFHPLLPVPLPKSDGKEHCISGAKAAQIDEVFYPPNGTHQFSDEDLNIWLSMDNPRIAQ